MSRSVLSLMHGRRITVESSSEVKEDQPSQSTVLLEQIRLTAEFISSAADLNEADCAADYDQLEQRGMGLVRTIECRIRQTKKTEFH